jgi:hypothetical protein
MFSRLKAYRKLDVLRARRMPTSGFTMVLSILAMNVAALAKVQAIRPGKLRACTRQVA